MWWVVGLLACGSAERRFEVKGTVVEVRSATELVVAHEAIDGFMDAMTMPFSVRGSVEGVDVGDQIAGTFVVAEGASWLEGVAVTVEAPPPEPEKPVDVPRGEPVPEGTLFPETPVVLAVGSPITLGQGQTGRIALTFIYTRCPVPEYCPLVVSRFQALQEKLPPNARLLAITMDPEYDSRGVLREFGEAHDAIPGKWDFGRLPKEVLVGVAEKAGLEVTGRGLEITHDLVMVVLDEDGRVVKRYRDFAWDMDEVVGLLKGDPK